MTGERLRYADLAHTPSGALTAASRRLIEAERRADSMQAMIDNAHRIAHRDEFALFDAATARYDAEFPDTEAQTEREERLTQAAHKLGEQEGADEMRWAFRENQESIVYTWIHRLEYLGLDTNLSTLEILRSIESELAATIRTESGA